MIIHDHTSLTAVIAHPALKIYFCVYDGSHIGGHFLGVIWQSRERLVMLFVKKLNSLR